MKKFFLLLAIRDISTLYKSFRYNERRLNSPQLESLMNIEDLLLKSETTKNNFNANGKLNKLKTTFTSYTPTLLCELLQKQKIQFSNTNVYILNNYFHKRHNPDITNRYIYNIT